MKPGPLDLPTIWRGCDWGPVTMKWKDQAGQPINLAGWQPRAQSLNVDLSPVITDESGGVTTLSLNKTQTANLRLGVENWDWIWERISDEYRFPPFLSGIVSIKEPQTQVDGTQPIVLPPENDNFANAVELFGDSGTVSGTTVNATREAGEPAGDASVWYQWTPSKPWNAVLGLATNFQNIGIYTGDAVNSLTQVAISDGNPSQVTWVIPENIPIYWIRIFKRLQNSAFSMAWRLELPG